MHSRVATLITIPLCVLALSAAAQEVRVVEMRNLRITAPPSATHLFQLHIYTFTGTRWRADDALEATAAAARLLEQCKAAVAAFELRVLQTPEQFRYYSTAVSRDLLRAFAPPRPAVFFVENTKNQPAFDAEAIGRGNSRSRPELADTVWIAYGARDLPVALAHELVHLLSDSGDHSDEPGNLMRAETSAGNVKLTQAQCERLRSRGEANGLLEPR